MKGLLVLLLLMTLAGCGDFEWFPENGTTTTTTTTPPVTPTQQTFNNVSTVTTPTLPVVDASGTIKVSTFTITPDKTSTTVTPTFAFDIGNFDLTTAATADVTITALDGAGNLLQSTKMTVTINANSRTPKQITGTALSVADYDRIRSWTITVVKQ